VGRLVGADVYKRFSVRKKENSEKMAELHLTIGTVDTILRTVDPAHVLKPACFLLLHSCGVSY
jgi:hypothetical protein